MKGIKKLITLLIAVTVALSSMHAFAYSPVGAGMLSAYYQNNESSPWQAEVTFERQWGGGLNGNALPIQQIARNETMIRTTAYFTKVPKDTKNAELIVCLFTDGALTAMTSAAVDVNKLTAVADFDVSKYIKAGEASYALRAVVWDGGFEGMKPMTCLREISTATFNINKIVVDGTNYYGTEYATVYPGLGIIDIDEDVIADITNVDLILSLGFTSNRYLIVNGTEYAYDAEKGGFVLDDVDLTNGLALTFKSGRSTAYYVINAKPVANFTPDDMVFKDATGAVINTPEPGNEVKLGYTTLAYDKTGTNYIASMTNVNFANEDYIKNLSDRIYTSLYNDDGELVYRMFSNGVPASEAPADIFYSFIDFAEASRPQSSYVLEMRFKAKAVTNPAATAVTSGIGLVPSMGIRVRNTQNKEIMYLGTPRSGKFGYYATNYEPAFFDNQPIQADKYYMVRVYARKLADGTTSYRYYSYSPANGRLLSHTFYSDTNALGNANWTSADAPLSRMRLDFNGSGYPSDLYVDHIRIYETEEISAQ